MRLLYTITAEKIAIVTLGGIINCCINIQIKKQARCPHILSYRYFSITEATHKTASEDPCKFLCKKSGQCPHPSSRLLYLWFFFNSTKRRGVITQFPMQ